MSDLIRGLLKPDVNDCITIHKEVLPYGMLSTFSDSSLRNILYLPSTLSTDKHSIVYLRGTKLIGFAIVRTCKTSKLTISNKFTLVREILTSFFRKPKLILASVVTMTHLTVMKRKYMSSDDVEIEILLVGSSYHSKGIGTKLLRTLTDTFSNKNIFVQTRSILAVRFYECNGFQLLDVTKIGKNLQLYYLVHKAG